ncbi:MAG TPA: ESX secretion-associated protein EspG [Pseudonocardiaceae bacterium]
MATTALLPALVADAIRDALDVTLPSALRVPWHGATMEERAILLERGWQEAEEYEIGTRDALHPFVRDAFHLLARPEVSVELVVGDVQAKRDHTAFAATDGGFALMARYDERGLMLEAVRPTGLAPALVGLLPPHPPGRGQSASVRTATLRAVTDRVGRQPAAMERELAAAGVRRADAEVIAAVLTAERVRGGQLCAIGYEQHGGKGHVVDLEVGFIDTEQGRYLTQNKPGEPADQATTADDGDRNHLTIAPADNARLVERIDEMITRAYALR